MTNHNAPSNVHISDFDLTPVAQEFLKYAPAYAQAEAAEAIYRVQELRAQGLLHDGLYYLVLGDIVGATRMTAKLGNKEMASRIQFFVRDSFGALHDFQPRNVALFLKEIGDAVLWVFSHFPDILRWHSGLSARLAIFNQSAWRDSPIGFRTIVHVGEVHLSGVNPVALAVSQAFKMEKHAAAGDILLSETAYRVAWPSIARAHHGFNLVGSVPIEGHDGDMQLYRLVTSDLSTPGVIAEEELP